MKETIEMIYMLALKNLEYAKEYWDLKEFGISRTFIEKAHEDIWVIYQMDSSVPYLTMIEKMPNIYKGEEVTKWWE